MPTESTSPEVEKEPEFTIDFGSRKFSIEPNGEIIIKHPDRIQQNEERYHHIQRGIFDIDSSAFLFNPDRSSTKELLSLGVSRYEDAEMVAEAIRDRIKTCDIHLVDRLWQAYQRLGHDVDTLLRVRPELQEKPLPKISFEDWKQVTEAKRTAVTHALEKLPPHTS